MKKPIRMIALDLDGTVFNSEKQVTPRVVAAIEKALAAGIVVLPATGRQALGIPEEFRCIPGVRYALVANGAKVYDLQTGEALYSDCFTPATTLDLLGECRRYKTLITLFLNGESYAEADDFNDFEGLVAPWILAYMRQSRQPVADLAAFIRQSPEGAEKFTLFFFTPEERDAAWAKLDARGDVCLTSSMYNNLEVNTPTANKGAALLALAKRLHIPREQVMAVGDSSNDAEMLRAAGYGVAMGNAGADIQALADAVTLSCDEDGVAEAIEAIL